MEHPITPPPELVEQWIAQIWHEGTPVKVAANDLHVANQAARWGWQQRDASVPEELQKARDTELEACCEWASQFNYDDYRYQDELRAARRPKPPSLAEQALAELDQIPTHDNEGRTVGSDVSIIRRALEWLQELEKGNE